MINDENMIRLKKPDMFSLERTLDCGQAFRWESDESGIFSGVAYGKVMRVKEEGDSLLFYGMKKMTFMASFTDTLTSAAITVKLPIATMATNICRRP